MSSRKKKMKKIKRTSLGLFLTLFFIVAIGLSFVFVQSNLSAVGPVGETSGVVISKGDTLNLVSDQLKEKGLIKNQFIFETYAKLIKLTDFKVGTYYVDYGDDVKTILTTLNDASKAHPTDVVVTIIPGDWARQIAENLASKVANVSADELLSLWNDEDYIRSLMDEYSVLTEQIFENKNDVRILLEGYLMPETYFMNPLASADSLTRRILNQTQKVYDDNKALFDNFGMSIHDAITLASVVQFEAGKESDMKLVSQVFLNRMNTGMRLQSSVTVCYALYEYDSWKDCENYDNQTIDSKYNTYLYSGLPVGPITNPSKMAILSTIQPTANNYYYFLADIYGDGTVYYAETFAQHEANIQKYLK